MLHHSHLDTQLHVTPAPIPQITPEIAEQLARESEEIRVEFHRRVKKTWEIPTLERLAVSK